ncbi:MAG: outer membrane beta-barrel protein [Ginsengibacter sp.]
MDKNLQNIEDLFRKGLEGNDEVPPEKVWNAIDQSLEKTTNLTYKKKYYFLKRATAVLAIVVVLLGVYIIRNESKHHKASNDHVITSKPQKNLNQNIDSATEAENQAPANGLQKDIIPGNKNVNPADEKEPGINKAETKGESQVDTSTALIPSNPAFDGNKKSNEQYRIFSKKNRKTRKTFSNEELSGNERINGEELRQPDFPLPTPVTFSGPQSLFSKKGKLNFKNEIAPFQSPSKTLSVIHIHNPALSRFYAAAFYSPNISFSRLRDEDHNSGNPYSRDFERREKESYSWSLGLWIGYRFNNRWAIQSGLNLSTLKMNIEPEKIFAERDNQGKIKYLINTSSGKGYLSPSFSNNPRVGDSLFARTINHSLQYTGIPIAAKYFLSNKKLSVNLLAGLSANILSHGKINTEVEKGTEHEHDNIHEINGLKPVYFSGLAGFGLSYNFYRSISVSLSPMLNFALEPINKNVPVNSYPGTVNFQLGITKDF